MPRLHSETQQKFADVSRKMGEARASNDADAAAGIRTSGEWKAYERAESDFFRQMGEMLDKAVSDNADTYWGRFC